MNNAYSNTNPQSNETMPQGNKDCLYPLWLGEKNSINEVIFCEDFVSKRPLKCINGRFYGVDGEISDNVINYSMIETAKENNLKPYDYLLWLFEKIRSVEDVETFLPWCEDLPENLKLKSV